MSRFKFFKKPSKKVVGEKLKWIIVMLVLWGVIYGSFTLSQYVSGSQVTKQKVDVVLDAGHGGILLRKNRQHPYTEHHMTRRESVISDGDTLYTNAVYELNG